MGLWLHEEGDYDDPDLILKCDPVSADPGLVLFETGGLSIDAAVSNWSSVISGYPKTGPNSQTESPVVAATFILQTVQA